MVNKSDIKIELLAPAGDMERLVSAVEYGADAVYLAGKTFGMRAAPSNFTDEQLCQAVEYAHSKGVKVYLTCNVLPRNNELAELPAFIEKAKKAGLILGKHFDGFITSGDTLKDKLSHGFFEAISNKKDYNL